jgi:hypothetical protein
MAKAKIVKAASTAKVRKAKSPAVAEVVPEIRVKQPAGSVHPVMSLPPPTGQPPKPPGKGPRLSDAASSFKPAIKRQLEPVT